MATHMYQVLILYILYFSGSSSKLSPVQKQKDSWFGKGSLLLKKRKLVAAASKKLESDKDSKRKAQKGGRTQELARAKYGSSSKERLAAAKGSTSPVKLVIPKVSSPSKGRRSAVSSIMDADVAHVKVKAQLSKEGL